MGDHTLDGVFDQVCHHPVQVEQSGKQQGRCYVVIVSLDSRKGGVRTIYYDEEKAVVEYINPYLTAHKVNVVPAIRKPAFTDVELEYGVYYSKSAGLLVTPQETEDMRVAGVPERYLKQFIGSQEFINGVIRYCLWISDEDVEEANMYHEIARRIEEVKRDRLATQDKAVNKLAARPHQFREFKGDENRKIFVPIVSSETREFFPAGLVADDVVPTNKAFFAPKAPLWALVDRF
jgi:hypothetical protein